VTQFCSPKGEESSKEDDHVIIPHKSLPPSPDSFCFIIHYENRKMILFTALLFVKIRTQFNPE
jgi:hypothetical protein